MNRKSWILLSCFGVLVILYMAFFTDWFAPAPIQISYQVRPTIAPPRFSRLAKKPTPPPVDPNPGDVAYVTFSLDDFYQVNSIKVWELKPTNGAPRMIWSIKGKTARPMNALLYGKIPDGLVSQIAPEAEPLKPNAPYRLEIQAGRHHGQVEFTTVSTAAPPEGG